MFIPSTITDTVEFIASKYLFDALQVYSEPIVKSDNFKLLPISINSISLRNQIMFASGFESTIQFNVNDFVLFLTIIISFGVSINFGGSKLFKNYAKFI